MPEPEFGVDIYGAYQQIVDPALLGSNVSYIYMKLTDGGNVAPTKPGPTVEMAKKTGRPLGGYHYAQPTPSPEQQAGVFIGQVRYFNLVDLVPMLDLEAPFTEGAAARDFGVRFCKEVARLGFRPGVYMNNAFAKALHPDQWGIPGLAIWIARYGAKPDPAAGRYDLHQFSSSSKVPGIKANATDVNWLYGDIRNTKEELFLMALTPEQQGAVYSGVNDMREDFSVPYREKGKSGGRVLRDLIPLSEPIQSKVDPNVSLPASELLGWIDKYTHDMNQRMEALESKLDTLLERLQ